MCILYSTFNIQHSTFNINIKQNMTTFQDKVKALRAHHEELLSRKNAPQNILHWSGDTTSMRRAIRISCSAS